MRHIGPSIAIAALSLTFAANAQALTSAQYDASNAIASHGLWLGGDTNLGHRYSISSGQFSIDAGTATANLALSVYSETLDNAGFEIDVSFSYVCSGIDAGLPGCGDFTVPQDDGLVDTTLADQQRWEFFELDGGTFSGTGALAGLELAISQRPGDGSKPFRIGEGANYFDWDFGGSGWFSFLLVANPTGLSLGADSGNGDFNLDLTPPAAVPVPAGIWLLLSALGAVGVSRKRA